MDNIKIFLEYYLTHNIFKITNKLKNTKKIGAYLSKRSCNKELEDNLLQKICKDYTFLTNHNYNKSIELDEINQYTVLNINIDYSMSLNMMAKTVLKNILKSEKILINNKPIIFYCTFHFIMFYQHFLNPFPNMSFESFNLNNEIFHFQ
jgi:hypothetical protein